MNKPPLIDADARRRIVTELDRSLLVEAGAGSGKTHELAARMAAGVASGAYQIEQMAAVTFTRKAAAELRGRFQIALEQELAALAGPAPQAGRIQHALSNIERFFAGTIHAFCARLLRERPVEAGVAPGFTELDDAEDALLREQSWRDYRSQAQAAGDPAYLALDDAGIKGAQLAKAFERVCLYEEVDFPPGDAAVPDDQAGWKALEAFWAELSRYLPDPIDPETTCDTQKHAGPFARDWRFFSRTRRTPALLATLLAHWEFTPKIVQMRWSDNAAEKKRLARLIPELHQAFRDSTAGPFLTAWRQHVYGVCITVLTEARRVAAGERRRRNTLSFNDLLLRTADVLRSNAGVRHALQQKHRWLFVDEFQDTDPIQAEIMFLLAGEQEGADWRTVSIRPGALFVVGDPKQSIYRFRRADIDIYNEVRARLAGDDGRGVVTLTSNFRSVPRLCEWANEVFDGLFPKEANEHTPKFAPLAAVRTDEDGAQGLQAQGLFTLTIPPDSPDGVADEAARIARFVHAEVAAKRRTHGDFLVLTRKKKALQRFADAFEALQIPIEVSGGGGFNESPEVQRVSLLLMALTDPQDVVALVGVLRGALFGLSDRELFAFRQAGGWFDGWSARGERVRERRSAGERGWGPASEQEMTAKVVAALATLRRWHRWTRVLPAGAALERILDDSGYLARAATSPGGVEAGDLLHAIDRVRAVVESGFTLAEAAAALASWSKLDDDGPGESSEIESLPLESGRRDVVRLMNLHKAKGLEAPVVFLADPTGGYPPQVDVRIVRSRAGEGAHGATAQILGPQGFFQIVPESKSHWKMKPIAEPVGWAALEGEEFAYLEAEHTRLLYVAATRAKDVLVVSRWNKRGTRTFAWQEFEPHLDRIHAPELVVPATIRLPPPAKMDLSEAAAGKAMRHAEGLHTGAMRASWSAASVTAEAKRLPRVAADDVPADDPTRVMTEETPSRRADAGLAWGTLVHGLLEHAMRHPPATREDLRRLAMWLTVEEPALRTLIDRALDTVESVTRAEFWTVARASQESHEEAPFSVHETEGGLPRVVSGTIDLVYRAGDGWQIVDYKTDADGAGADLAARYASQIEAYGRAWGKVSGAPVTSSVVAARERP
jgi:ATP-dependent helicase/nuclease subunit A